MGLLIIPTQMLRTDPVEVQISGIAIVENETVVTRNIKHFEKVEGLKVESY